MASRSSVASVLLFVGSTLCFFLPFVTVSCGGMKAFTLTGQQMATGTTLTQPQPFGPPQAQKIGADPFAAIAWICAIAGIPLSLAGRKLAAGTAVSGTAGAVALLVFHSRLDEQIQKQGEGMATVSSEAGFTLAVLLLIAGTAWNVYLFIQNRRAGTARIPAASASNARVGPESVDAASPPACVHCGKPIPVGMRFCESCGKPAQPAG